ncbi:MAG: laccase domain-containing protein [bacterium]
MNIYNFKIYSSTKDDFDQKNLINRINLVKNKFNKLNVILPIQKHTNKILKLSYLLKPKVNYLKEELSFDGIYFDNNDIYIFKYFSIGVLTADCLPIVILVFNNDMLNNLDNSLNLNNYLSNYLNSFIIGSILHAGWKGIFNNIIFNFFDILNNYINNYKNLKIFIYIGPAIRNCCYEVKYDFINTLNINTQFYYQKNNKIFLDLISIAKSQIQESIKCLSKLKKIEIEIIDTNECTYCSNKYFSYRKGDNKQRNITILSL